MTTGERIRLMREALAMSPLAFACKANVHLSMLNAVEAGMREAPTSFLHRVARFLDVSVEYLQSGEGGTGLTARPGFKLLVRRLDALSVTKQDALLTIFNQSLSVADGMLNAGNMGQAL
jgi:transcriptional regulator with XRE-family HTH domain